MGQDKDCYLAPELFAQIGEQSINFSHNTE